MSHNLADTVEAIRLVVIALLSSHLAHDLRPDVTAQALLDLVMVDPSPGVEAATREIGEAAQGLAEIARAAARRDGA